MEKSKVGQGGYRAASAILFVAGMLAACAPRVEAPAPVVSGGPVEPAPLSITVQRGQTLSGIAHTYHVPTRVIAEANGLSPPYRIQVGRSLIIPGMGQPQAPTAPSAIAALPPGRAEEPQAPATRLELPGATNSPEPVPADRPVPAPERPPVTAAPLSAPLVSPPAEEGIPPVVKSSPAPTAPDRPASAEPPPAVPPARGSGAFAWPVRGHIVAAYGSRSDGTHNDGINIAAPKGAAVEAADAGVVAYTGNELRGYGNLILIKHANGWISAYAHCDQILVKRGEKVTRGQLIARVGSTGNVSEPQLHFELRRGNHAVDPREFLAPLPTAAAKDSRSG